MLEGLSIFSVYMQLWCPFLWIIAYLLIFCLGPTVERVFKFITIYWNMFPSLSFLILVFALLKYESFKFHAGKFQWFHWHFCFIFWVQGMEDNLYPTFFLIVKFYFSTFGPLIFLELTYLLVWGRDLILLYFLCVGKHFSGKICQAILSLTDL